MLIIVQFNMMPAFVLQQLLLLQGRSRPAPGCGPAPREQDLQANLHSALANVVDLQTQNQALLEQLKGANDEISDSVFPITRTYSLVAS